MAELHNGETSRLAPKQTKCRMTILHTGSTKMAQEPLVGNTDPGNSCPIQTFEAEARRARLNQRCAH